ncbi:MAG: hypothetical protein NVSMB44_40500 [Ktedonobacteraceae bacterium]
MCDENVSWDGEKIEIEIERKDQNLIVFLVRFYCIKMKEKEKGCWVDFGASWVVSERYGRAARWGSLGGGCRESWSGLLRALKCSGWLCNLSQEGRNKRDH